MRKGRKGRKEGDRRKEYKGRWRKAKEGGKEGRKEGRNVRKGKKERV